MGLRLDCCAILIEMFDLFEARLPLLAISKESILLFYVILASYISYFSVASFLFFTVSEFGLLTWFTMAVWLVPYILYRLTILSRSTFY